MCNFVLMGEHCDYCEYFWIDECDPSGSGFPCQYRGTDENRPCEKLAAELKEKKGDK